MRLPIGDLCDQAKPLMLRSRKTSQFAGKHWKKTVEETSVSGAKTVLKKIPTWVQFLACEGSDASSAAGPVDSTALVKFRDRSSSASRGRDGGSARCSGSADSRSNGRGRGAESRAERACLNVGEDDEGVGLGGLDGLKQTFNYLQRI
jgi:hypothetical protein